MRTVRRRRLEGKTDYKARLALLKSGKVRLVVRKTNRYIIAQFVKTDIAQDAVIAGFSSKDLLSKGWPKELSGSLKSRAAAYLTGFALANKVKDKVKNAILDIGMNRNIGKSRIYAVLKGALDAGIDIPHKPEAVPSDEDIKKNDKTSSVVDKLKGAL